MTTTVRVQAHAWGATVETNGETHEVGGGQERSFMIPEGQSQSFTVTHGEAPVTTGEESAQTEEVIERRSPPATPPTGNQSGATETAATTDTKRKP